MSGHLHHCSDGDTQTRNHWIDRREGALSLAAQISCGFSKLRRMEGVARPITKLNSNAECLRKVYLLTECEATGNGHCPRTPADAACGYFRDSVA